MGDKVGKKYKFKLEKTEILITKQFNLYKNILIKNLADNLHLKMKSQRQVLTVRENHGYAKMIDEIQHFSNMIKESKESNNHRYKQEKSRFKENMIHLYGRISDKKGKTIDHCPYPSNIENNELGSSFIQNEFDEITFVLIHILRDNISILEKNVQELYIRLDVKKTEDVFDERLVLYDEDENNEDEHVNVLDVECIDVLDSGDDFGIYEQET